MADTRKLPGVWADEADTLCVRIDESLYYNLSRKTYPNWVVLARHSGYVRNFGVETEVYALQWSGQQWVPVGQWMGNGSVRNVPDSPTYAAWIKAMKALPKTGQLT